ncbi:TrbI/VirB10 family protein [Enterovibrio norvegicus]|uniref:TrbI/VirB10 family protein n=1 Tax=Enterovibrio norvegicus TaxID=188144 RepID=A0ABV4L5R5_9GAMM
MIKNFKKWLTKEPDIDDGLVANTESTKRNQILSVIVIGVLVIAFAVFKSSRPTKPVHASTTQEEEAPDFGEIITDDFTNRDNRSALTLQGQALKDVQDELSTFKDHVSRFESDSKSKIEALQKENDELRKEVKRAGAVSAPSPSSPSPSSETAVSLPTSDASSDFGVRPLPPKPAPSYATNDLMKGDFQYDKSASVSFDSQGGGFDSFDFYWETPDDQVYRRTTKNYVPSGTFVTAKITGGADANAGAFGQSDTAPIVFQTVHDGVLPNGEKSYLNNCTIIGSVYGDLSSSRGIVRTNTLSCVHDGRIIDIPVQGTAFNFGRNGIRGTSVLRNGKIIQMAGIAGILTGLGEAGKGLATTTSTSALGSTSSVNGEDIGLNLLGNATSEVGSKLSDYYIALAELYHPFIEVNPGGYVNIVFTAGFPLDDEGIEKYEARLADDKEQGESNGLLETITLNPLAQQVNQTLQ